MKNVYLKPNELFGPPNIYILFHILFHYGLSQDTEYSSLCYTVGHCCLSMKILVRSEVLHNLLPFHGRAALSFSDGREVTGVLMLLSSQPCLFLSPSFFTDE